MASLPQVGQTVRIRQRQYLVEDVRPGAGANATVVRMACLDDDAQGQPLEALWEHEIDAEPVSGETWDGLTKRGFDPPRMFSAYYHTLKWNRVTATDPKLFQAPFRAGIKIEAYQLEPVRKALQLPRVNLFIADDVGLGKTIEAGLIARELLLRRKVRDIVVACPPSMLYQWQDELETRFGLMVQILDKEYITRVRRERGYSINPWTTHSRFLISHRLLIDEEYAGPMRDWLGELRPGALLILDEAHHAAPASGAKYAIDSKITRAVRDLAPRFEHRLFLSATPHNGHSNSFSALLEILDPQRFCRGVPVRGKKLLEDVMVRRLKDDLRLVAGGFPKRNVKQVDLDGLPEDAPELLLSRKLDEYRSLREGRLKGETKRKQAAAGLLICGLQQRLLSSVEAFARTLRVHRRTVLKHWQQAQSGKAAASTEAPAAARLDLVAGPVSNDDDRATLPEEQLQAEDDAQVEAASTAAMGPLGDDAARRSFTKEQKLLDEMTEIADRGRAMPDARVRYLIDWIRNNMCPRLPKTPGAIKGEPPGWNDTRVLIFTEYDDTKRYLQQQLAAAITGTDRAEVRIEIYHGPTPPAKREEIKRAFNADPKKQPLRILICTDAAREGLNLQCYCWNLFHFDVPWNPTRMEQRNGRIDRKLQPKPEVNCHYFLYKQRVEDRVLQVLVKKTKRIKEELGSLTQVLEGKLASTLRLGIRHADESRLIKELEAADVEAEAKRTVQEELEDARERQEDLKDQIDRLRNGLSTSRKWLGLDEDHFRDAISCSLELLGAAPLKPMAKADGLPERCTFPALDTRDGADASWADTVDSLRAPRERDQKPWEWRKDAPIRPVVFQAPETMDESVVHLHLEHRVVQRLLSRFLAQGFVHFDLSRACLTQTEDAIPRVILLGRLNLYGPGAARLHEDIITVSARWIEPTRRKDKLTPFGREGEDKALDLFEASLLRPEKKIDPVTVKKLQESGSRDVQELLPHLQSRAAVLAREASEDLTKRGEVEAAAMRKILEDQKKRVAETAGKFHDDDMLPGFDDEARRQLAANRRHWAKRLTTLDAELKTEPERVREVYQVKATRVEPVGLVYLWPVTG